MQQLCQSRWELHGSHRRLILLWNIPSRDLPGILAKLFLQMDDAGLSADYPRTSLPRGCQACHVPEISLQNNTSTQGPSSFLPPYRSITGRVSAIQPGDEEIICAGR